MRTDEGGEGCWGCEAGLGDGEGEVGDGGCEADYEA